MMTDTQRIKNEEAIALLDRAGRHRSEWCYAPYDGRKSAPPKNGGSA